MEGCHANELVRPGRPDPTAAGRGPAPRRPQLAPARGPRGPRAVRSLEPPRALAPTPRDARRRARAADEGAIAVPPGARETLSAPPARNGTGGSARTRAPLPGSLACPPL